MKISKKEQEAIITVLEIGKVLGYGNTISHLQTAWAKMLVNQGYDENEAREITSKDGQNSYPFKMQEDLVQRGEWDETGKKYK